MLSSGRQCHAGFVDPLEEEILKCDRTSTEFDFNVCAIVFSGNDRVVILEQLYDHSVKYCMLHSRLPGW